MKYIRTKDGRIIDTDNYEVKRETYENGELKFYEFWTTRFLDREIIRLGTYEIVKQADTINELCDMFVANNKTFYTINETLPELVCCDDATIYGAIWTEWGLKYVAKMNDKGELELL